MMVVDMIPRVCKVGSGGRIGEEEFRDDTLHNGVQNQAIWSLGIDL